MARKTKPGPGRPELYSDELADCILDRIADGESLRAICAAPGMPSRWTVFRWLRNHTEFATKHAHARELQADLMDDRILSTAEACKPETASADRVKLDAYKWRAAKLAPKKYGDKVALTGGDESDAPIRQAITVEFIRPKPAA